MPLGSASLGLKWIPSEPGLCMFFIYYLNSIFLMYILMN